MHSNLGSASSFQRVSITYMLTRTHGFLDSFRCGVVIRNLDGSGLTTLPAGVFSPLANLVTL